MRKNNSHNNSSSSRKNFFFISCLYVSEREFSSSAVLQKCCCATVVGARAQQWDTETASVLCVEKNCKKRTPGKEKTRAIFAIAILFIFIFFCEVSPSYCCCVRRSSLTKPLSCIEGFREKVFFLNFFSCIFFLSHARNKKLGFFYARNLSGSFFFIYIIDL